MKNKAVVVLAQLGLLFTLQIPTFAAEEMVQVVSGVSMTKSDAARLHAINKLLHERQPVLEGVMRKLEVKQFKPQLPNYQLMSENSVFALVNQMNYTSLAEKLGAEIPKRPELETGVPLKNNRFLHAYNNALLRAISKKLGVEEPAVVDLNKGSLEEQCFGLVSQNSDMMHKIAQKVGAEQK